MNFMQTFNSSSIKNIRSAVFGAEINATIDLADNCRVTSSGLELHPDINGIKVESFKFDSHPSNADGYNRLMTNSNGCKRDGRSLYLIASLAVFNSDKKKSYKRGYL